MCQLAQSYGCHITPSRMSRTIGTALRSSSLVSTHYSVTTTPCDHAIFLVISHNLKISELAHWQSCTRKCAAFCSLPLPLMSSALILLAAVDTSAALRRTGRVHLLWYVCTCPQKLIAFATLYAYRHSIHAEQQSAPVEIMLHSAAIFVYIVRLKEGQRALHTLLHKLHKSNPDADWKAS